MTIPVGELRGITPEIAGKLKNLGIKDSDDLIAQCKTPKQRSDFAKKAEVDAKALMELCNRADLVRIKGVAGAYSDLLEEAGVDTVKELAGRVPANLQAKLAEVSAAKKGTGRVPTLAMVEDWVAEAKTLPKALEY
jgi:predicted flap endonuclease-1-like 5' DNA nuclease